MLTAFERKLFIAIDAEQSYLQDAIRAITEQYQYLYKDSGYSILNTYQGYLKTTKWQIEVEV